MNSRIFDTAWSETQILRSLHIREKRDKVHVPGLFCRVSPWVWGGRRCPGCRSRPASLWSSALWRSWSCCWVRGAAPGTPAPSLDCPGWCCDETVRRQANRPTEHLTVSLFSITLTRSWRRAPPARPPADWGGCAPPACSSAARSCWPTAAAESGSHCWWRTGRSGSRSACPPSADRQRNNRDIIVIIVIFCPALFRSFTDSRWARHAKDCGIRRKSYLQYGVTGGDLVVQQSDVLTLLDVWRANRQENNNRSSTPTFRRVYYNNNQIWHRIDSHEIEER